MYISISISISIYLYISVYIYLPVSAPLRSLRGRNSLAIWRQTSREHRNSRAGARPKHLRRETQNGLTLLGSYIGSPGIWENPSHSVFAVAIGGYFTRTYEQALVCFSNRETVDASGGRPFHCKMANNRLITVVFSNWFGRIYLAI